MWKISYISLSMNNLINFQEPQVMGVINCTPDSFYSGSRINDIKAALHAVERMLAEGADIIDIGAMSSRPGAVNIEPEEEWARMKEILVQLKKEHPTVPISVDTYHGYVVQHALDIGVDMINDISAFQFDNSIPEIVSKYNAYYCLMHMQKSPKTMQEDPKYQDVVLEVFEFLKDKLQTLKEHGIHKVVIDPGFGFGKTINHNYLLLKQLEVFKILNKPVLIGISRKSMITKLLGIEPQDSLPATTALHLMALMNGASILRVHDVKEAKQAIILLKQLSTTKIKN